MGAAVCDIETVLAFGRRRVPVRGWARRLRTVLVGAGRCVTLMKPFSSALDVALAIRDRYRRRRALLLLRHNGDGRGCGQ